MPVFLSQRTVRSITTLEMGEQFQFQRQGDLWITTALRTQPWLASGWGCRGRRLSRASGNLCRRRGPLHGCPAKRRRGRVPAELTSEIPLPLVHRCPVRDRLPTHINRHYRDVVESDHREVVGFALQEFNARFGSFRFIATAARMVGGRYVCITVSTGEALSSSAASFSASDASPARARASASPL